jgi:hypothetical protein
VRRADFRKAAAYASHQFGFDPPATPSHQDDRAAAVAITHKAADIACANDFGQMIDGGGLGFVDSALLADAYATLAMSYRYAVGFHATDSTLSDLGEAASEYNYAFSVNTVPAAGSVPTCDAFGEALSSTLSIFERPGQDEEIVYTLDTLSRRLKDEILHVA